MAAVGIWLWSAPAKFGQHFDCDPTLTVVGVPARFSLQPLRIVSLTMYSIVLIPGFNLIPPFVFFLALHVSYNWFRQHHESFSTFWDNALAPFLRVVMRTKSSSSPDPEHGTSQPSAAGNLNIIGASLRLTCVSAVPNGFAPPETSLSSPNTAPIDATAYPASPSDSRAVAQPGTSGTSLVLPIVNTAYPPSIPAVSNDVARPGTFDSSPNPHPIVNPVVSGAITQPGTPHTAFLIVGLALLVAINILFIIDIELTLRRNKGDQNADDVWGFGQVLALLLLIIPLRDAWGALKEIRDRRKNNQEQFAEILLRECQAAPDFQELQKQLEANTKSLTIDPRFTDCLQQAAYQGKIELVKFLLKEGFDDKPGTIPTSDHVYIYIDNTNRLKVNRRYSLHS
jgi:hypothetical protein